MSSAGGNHSQKTKEINDNKVDSDEEIAIRNIAQPDEITNNTNMSELKKLSPSDIELIRDCMFWTSEAWSKPFIELL